MEQTQLTTRPNFLEKWTPRLNLGMLIATGASLIGMIIFFFILMVAAVGSGDGPAPHDVFIEVTKVLLNFFNICFVSLLFIAGIVLPIVNALYLKRYWSAISKRKRIFSMVTLVITCLFFVFVVIPGLVAAVLYLTL